MTFWGWLTGTEDTYRDQAFLDRVKALQAEIKPVMQLYGKTGGLSRYERERRKTRSLIRFQDRKRA